MQSGAFCFWGYAPNPRKEALNIALFLGCPENEDPKEVRKCLEGKSVKDLLIGQTTVSQVQPHLQVCVKKTKTNFLNFLAC